MGWKSATCKTPCQYWPWTYRRNKSPCPQTWLFSGRIWWFRSKITAWSC